MTRILSLGGCSHVVCVQPVAPVRRGQAGSDEGAAGADRGGQGAEQGHRGGRGQVLEVSAALCVVRVGVYDCVCNKVYMNMLVYI